MVWANRSTDVALQVRVNPTANTTEGNSRASRESGSLCSHSLRALLSVCGRCSFGGLGCYSCRVRVCRCRGCCSLSVCVCVTC